MKTSLTVGALSVVVLCGSLGASAQVITTVAGGGTPTPGFCGDGGPATDACLNLPANVAVDANSNQLIADQGNHRIRSVDGTSGIITTVAGNGTAGFCGDGGPATSACVNYPTDVAVDGTGNQLIADQGNHRIRSVDGTSGIITTVAGSATAGFCGDGGPATSACLNSPHNLALDPTTGDLYIADFYNHRVRRVDATTRIITTVAGSGTEGFCGDGGPATSACLDFPNKIVVDASSNLFIADYFNNRVRMVDPTTGIITTVAGNGASGFCGDGDPATSTCLTAVGLAVDDTGNLFIATWTDNRVRMVDAATGIMTTVAGNGTYAFCGDGGPATSACLSLPGGVTVVSGTLLIADYANHRVRVVQ
jgi:sugar lactone lactonase YvrE